MCEYAGWTLLSAFVLGELGHMCSEPADCVKLAALMIDSVPEPVPPKTLFSCPEPALS